MSPFWNYNTYKSYNKFHFNGERIIFDTELEEGWEGYNDYNCLLENCLITYTIGTDFQTDGRLKDVQRVCEKILIKNDTAWINLLHVIGNFQSRVITLWILIKKKLGFRSKSEIIEG